MFFKVHKSCQLSIIFWYMKIYDYNDLSWNGSTSWCPFWGPRHSSNMKSVGVLLGCARSTADSQKRHTESKTKKQTAVISIDLWWSVVSDQNKYHFQQNCRWGCQWYCAPILGLADASADDIAAWELQGLEAVGHDPRDSRTDSPTRDIPVVEVAVRLRPVC